MYSEAFAIVNICNDDPEKVEEREESIRDQIQVDIAQIQTLLTLFESRNEFEKRLAPYIKARISFEENIDKAGNIIDMLNLNEVVDVKPKLKQTIVTHLMDAQKMAISVGEAYNLLANYSLNMQPESPGCLHTR